MLRLHRQQPLNPAQPPRNGPRGQDLSYKNWTVRQTLYAVCTNSRIRAQQLHRNQYLDCVVDENLQEPAKYIFPTAHQKEYQGFYYPHSAIHNKTNHRCYPYSNVSMRFLTIQPLYSVSPRHDSLQHIVLS